MIEIQIAGAGAGKTYGLAEAIIKHHNMLNIPKNIFALTYTNSAKDKIETELQKKLKVIPANIKVQTVHSFLLNEVIYPYSNYILGDIYNKASIIPLSDNLKYKAMKIRNLKERNIIHSERVYAVAKQILDKSDNKNKTLIKKKKIDYVLNILSERIACIFIDEVQDLDCDALAAFSLLGYTPIYMYMIGDPKQAIKWPHDFMDFIEKVKLNSDKSVKCLEIINTSRRVPQKILSYSNKFCYKGQEQTSLSCFEGRIYYIESTNVLFHQFMENHIAKKSIICIDKKTGIYNTQHDVNYGLPTDIEDKLLRSCKNKDQDIYLRAAYQEFRYFVDKNECRTVNRFKTKYNLDLDRKEFAQLCELCKLIYSEPSTYNVSSIDSVKGLEADTCVIILTPSTYKYLLQNELKEDMKFNKEWKKMYVALTRTRDQLVFVIDHDIFKSLNIKDVVNNIEKMGICNYVTEMEIQNQNQNKLIK